MRIIGFDTSTSELYVAISENRSVVGQVVVSPQVDSRQYAASELIPTLERLLHEHAWSKSSIGAIAIGIGPGSFTGVRVGVVTARTLAQALNLPLIGVSTFDCYAATATLPATFVLDAGRGYVYAAKCGPAASDNLNHLKAPFADKLASLVNLLPQDSPVLASPSITLALSELGFVAQPLPPIKNLASLQCEIASNRLSLEGKDLFPYERVEPLYLREASVTLKTP